MEEFHHLWVVAQSQNLAEEGDWDLSKLLWVSNVAIQDAVTIGELFSLLQLLFQLSSSDDNLSTHLEMPQQLRLSAVKGKQVELFNWKAGCT